MMRPSSRSISSILPGCSRHFGTMLLSSNSSTPISDAMITKIIVGDQVARRAQAVAVQRGADLAAVGEGNGGRAVPRLHQRGMVLVEGRRSSSISGLPAQASGISIIIAWAASNRRKLQQLQRIVEAGACRTGPRRRSATACRCRRRTGRSSWWPSVPPSS
jgi:hypothetical protein